MATGIKVKLTYEALDSLIKIYTLIVDKENPDYAPVNSHEVLLFTHANLLYERIAKMGVVYQKEYTFKLDPAEAIAFKHLWTECGIAMPDEYTAVNINAIVAKADSIYRIDKSLVYCIRKIERRK